MDNAITVPIPHRVRRMRTRMKTRRTYFNPTSPPRKVKSTQTCKMKQKRKRTKRKIYHHTNFAIRRRLKKHLNLLRSIFKKLFGLLWTPATCATNSSWITGTSTTKFYCAMGATCKCTRAVTASKRFQTASGCARGARMACLISSKTDGVCALYARRRKAR